MPKQKDIFFSPFFIYLEINFFSTLDQDIFPFFLHFSNTSKFVDFYIMFIVCLISLIAETNSLNGASHQLSLEFHHILFQGPTLLFIILKEKKRKRKRRRKIPSENKN